MQPHVSALPPLEPELPAAAPAARRNLARPLAMAALALVLTIPLALLARQLWQEWSLLMQEERTVASAAVIGFHNIYPAISRAGHPEPWHRSEGAEVFIWSGWKHGEGHRWFKLAAGDCDLSTLGNPIGRDVARAIDHPEVETGGGEIWARMPEEVDVAGFATGRTACAYPKLVLGKVLVVNDVIDGVPRLVHYDPFQGPEAGPDVAVYDARVDGRRITLGSCGFSMGRRHVLYDRGTESLWVERGDGLQAFSGQLKGKTLALVDRLPTTTWSDWRSDNPGTRLLVGALAAPEATASR